MNPDTVKQLEFLQNNISRMNNCSFQMKGWALTIVSALLALYASSVNAKTLVGNSTYLLVAIVPTILFWFLDSYYLCQERKMRGIYNDLIGVNPSNSKLTNGFVPYSMPLNLYTGGKYSMFRVMLSRTILPLYGCILIGLITSWFIL